MHRAIVLSVIAMLSIASDAVAKKGGPLPRLDPRRDEKAFQRKLALAQDLHVQNRCGAAYIMYLELQAQQPKNPDVLWGLGVCGALTAQFPELGQDARRQRLLDARAAYEAYVAAEKRPRYTSGSNNRVALARERAAQLDPQIAALPAPAPAAPASAADAREFPRHAETLPICQGKPIWHPDYGFDPEFAWQLFERLHAEPELRVTIHGLPMKWQDGARQLLRSVNDLVLGKDRSHCQNHGFCVTTVLRDFKTYVDRVGFVTVRDEPPGPARVTLHHPNGINVTVVRCDAVRGALEWAVEEKQRQGTVAVGTNIQAQDRSVALALAEAGAQPDASAAAPPPAPPLREGEGERVGAPPPAEPQPAADAAPVPAPAPVADAAPPPAAVAAAPPPPPPAAAAPADAARAEAERALEALTISLRARPNNLTLQEAWVLTATQAERCAEVMPVYLRIAEESKRPKVHQAGAACAEALKQPRETFLALERYVRTSPSYEVSADTYRVIAEGFVELDKRGRAKHYFEQFLARVDRSDPHWADAERFVQGFKRARTDCFIQRGVATAALAQVGDRWVVQVRIPPDALEQAPACGE